MQTAQGVAGSRFSTRELVYVAIFGAAWGLVETSLGSYLHAARVPFRGALLTSLGLLLALCARTIVPRRGVVLMTGLVTVILRLLNLGAVLLSPLLAIALESLLAELVLWPFARPGRGAFALAGAVATLWTVVHPFVAQGLLAGKGLLTVYTWMIEAPAQVIPFWANLVWLLVGCAVALPLALGAAAGLAAHGLGQRLQARLAR
jgi:hypothetical protein